MIKYVEHNGIMVPAIIVPGISVTRDVRKLREALIDILDKYISKTNSKDVYNTISVRYLVRLIDETTIIDS